MNDLIEGPGSKLVPTGFIIFFGVFLITATSALLYSLYAMCPVCEPPEIPASVAPTTTADTPKPTPSQSPGVTTSPTPTPELRLVAVTPNSGPVEGNNVLRLDGIGLNIVKEVRFGGQPAALVGLPKPTSLMVKPPAHVEGPVDVIVSDGQNRDTSANPEFYTYTCPQLTGKNVVWMMILAGALGGILHSLRSFYWYVGSRHLIWSWVPMYFFLPFIGAGTSTIFYLIIRGGLMPGSEKSYNVFGLMAIGTLVGLFSQLALLTLEKVAGIIFTEPVHGRDNRRDALQRKDAQKEKPSLEVERVVPPEGQENRPVIILGSGFVKGKVRVRFGDKVAKVPKVEDQEITVTTPENPLGNVKVVVIQDGASLEVPGGFTYKNAQPVSENESGGEDDKQ
ncbi:MAG TPA: IPT/TIG domain-containing protein [Blastocatellia bacterium]|nr:IPT/TIG domain-containing protein [Blastocatellia bacterium]